MENKTGKNQKICVLTSESYKIAVDMDDLNYKHVNILTINIQPSIRNSLDNVSARGNEFNFKIVAQSEVYDSTMSINSNSIGHDYLNANINIYFELIYYQQFISVQLESF